VLIIKSLRQLLFPFGKLELPNDPELNQAVIEKFLKTDQDIGIYNAKLGAIADAFDDGLLPLVPIPSINGIDIGLVRKARKLLAELFSTFDHLDIHPRHGPGSVSTKEQFEDKYVFRNISPRILQTYPLDAYFYASLGHVCDKLVGDKSTTFNEDFAQVVLVPKDSRGPRLISMEPLAFQWIQQGLGRAIMSHVETSPLTREAVHFTKQDSNRFVALIGSKNGSYATMDLSEASDRVSLGLVRLLFPEPLLSALMNCRSLGTVLPSKEKLVLKKFAPMGSALCFPILALTIWALLRAGLTDDGCAYARRGRCIKCADLQCEDFLVFGDDVVVKTAKAAHATKILEAFGLVINQAKSFSSGFFRESCGMDAYKGIPVTPVKFKTVWTSHPSPESYVSYIAYANAMHGMRFYETYDTLVEWITRLYGKVPEVCMNLSCPSLVEVPQQWLPDKRRLNLQLQKLEWKVTDVRTPKVTRAKGGWNMLLRFLSLAGSESPLAPWASDDPRSSPYKNESSLSVSEYTKRDTSELVKRWR